MKSRYSQRESDRKNRLAACVGRVARSAGGLRGAALAGASAAFLSAGGAKAQIAGYQGVGNLTYATSMPGGGATTGNWAFFPFWQAPNWLFLDQWRNSGLGIEVQSLRLSGAVLYNGATNTAAAAFMVPGNTVLTQWDPWGIYPTCGSQANFQVDMLVGAAGLNVTSAGLQTMVVCNKGVFGAAQVNYQINYFSYNTVTGASIFLGTQAFTYNPPPGFSIAPINIPAGFLGAVNIPFVAGGPAGSSQWVFRSVGAIQFLVNNEDGQVDMRMASAQEGECPFVSPPLDRPLIPGRTLELKVAAVGEGDLSYRWRKNGADLIDGPSDGGGIISGADSDTLIISDAGLNDGGSYDVVVTSDCGIVISDASTVTAYCPADSNRDGFVDGIDYDQFNLAFEQGHDFADYNADGFVDGMDYDEFNNAFETPCP